MNDIKEKLKELTARSDEEISIINEILNSHFIIGKNNKEKTINLLMEKLDYDYDKADEIYNIASKIITTNIKDKIIHPFKSID